MDTNPNKHLARDTFLYLLAVVALAMSAVNFGTLLFQFINIYIPDVLSDRYSSIRSYQGTIRWAVSALVIVFPVLVWVTRFLRRDMRQYQEKRELKIRKWLLYFTLFVAGGIVVGDLIALIYNFLEGELTTRFVLKILSILVIAGSVFSYYLRELREVTAAPAKLFERLVVVLVAVAVIGGFVLAGSPQSQRLVRLDDQRVQDLSTIQWQVISFWQNKRRLPTGLDELRSDITGFVAPTDPETGQSYEYRVATNLSFELCATFAVASEDDLLVPKPRVPSDVRGELESWKHTEGQTCFTRTIDPDFYPPLERKQ